MIKRLAQLPIVNIVIVVLGALLLNEFYKQLVLGQLSVSGFAEMVHSVAHTNSVPSWWKQSMFWIAHHSAIFAPLFALSLATGGVCSLLLVARGIITLLIAIILFIFWISLWGIPGIWSFELLFPAVFALCASLANLRQPRIIGNKLFGDLKLYWRLVIVVLASALLWYVIILSNNAKEFNTIVAWQSAVTFAILFGATALVDKYRLPVEESERFRATPYVDVMILTVAAMMVIQVYADYALNFYTKETYAALVRSYAATTNSPDWFKAFLSWSAEHADMFMPIQAIFEALSALLLSLLVLRGPVLLLTTCMFVVFMFGEFGAYAEYPGRPGTPLTWTWEMLFITSMCFFISLEQLAHFIQASSWRDRLLGKRVFGNLSMKWRIAIAIAVAVVAVLSFADLKAYVLKKQYIQTAWKGGVTFAVLLMINAFLDKLRNRRSF